MKKPFPPLYDEQGEIRSLQRGETPEATLLCEDFPELAAYSEKRMAGRPKSANPKRVKSFKLSVDLIEAICATGRGYNARVEMALRMALNEGRI